MTTHASTCREIQITSSVIATSEHDQEHAEDGARPQVDHALGRSCAVGRHGWSIAVAPDVVTVGPCPSAHRP